MTDRPLVSTITPCFRMKKYLKTFLEWLPRQTIFNQLEIVLDHNEPSSEELVWVKEFQQRHPGRLRHILVEKVDPIGISMNRCIREATADIVAIWNVDDLRTPDSLEKQLLTLQQGKADIAYGNSRIVTSFGSTQGDLIRHDTIPASELTRSMILGPFYMFRKSLCQTAGWFDEQLRSGADFDLAIRLALHGKAAVTRELLGYYLDEGLGASTRPGSLQPIERTVIELRYGIYDKIDYSQVARAARYNIPFLFCQNQWYSVKDFVPNFEQFMETRRVAWHAKGVRAFCREEKRKRNVLWRGARTLKRKSLRLVNRALAQ